MSLKKETAVNTIRTMIQKWKQNDLTGIFGRGRL